MSNKITRLSDEEPDAMETADAHAINDLGSFIEDFSVDTLIDLEKGISKVLNEKEEKVLSAKLSGYTYRELAVTKKYWSYHLNNAVIKLKDYLK